MSIQDSREGLSSKKAVIPLQAKLSAILAAVILFQSVLVLAGGFGWSLAGLLGWPEAVAWAGGVLALVLAALASVWLLRRALSVERERVEQEILGLEGEGPEGSPSEPEEPPAASPPPSEQAERIHA